ncbi:het domain-containing [Trichoderma arundinaceum]|uniref:Het domain-containing n=1 Tax=Trichoderma arundinaceum TaxID=490622 RepID=A0A395NNV5_TRIAR|nr:het domain-containing [Trichoderma arundinaceum]
MRLINAITFTLEEFLGTDVPKYAILSHTWEEEEVTFQDFNHQEIRSQKKGFHKLQKLCELAKQDGLQYAWADTCCIDKTSSSELTEAINSMFRFYLDAEVCYAWLMDLPADNRDIHYRLDKCRWFTRGWTLQELIAPRVLKFYDETWKFRGTKSNLRQLITQITKISGGILKDPTRLSQLPVAQKMSWAANRQTTRIEDMAYSLLGLFEVNMPMIYGEGSRAFLRLQEEIAKEKNDPSLFAWRAASPGQTHYGMFASTPADFRNSGSVHLINDPMFSTEYLISNKGLRIDSDLFPVNDRIFFMDINCVDLPPNRTTTSATSSNSVKLALDQRHIGILIKSHGGGVYSRVEADRFAIPPGGSPLHSIRVFLPKHVDLTRSLYLENLFSYSFVLRKGVSPPSDAFPFTPLVFIPETEWDTRQHKFPTRGRDDFSAYAHFRAEPSFTNSSDFVLAFGNVKEEGGPWIGISLAEDLNIYPYLGDAKKVGHAARKKRNTTVKVRYDENLRRTYYVHVSLKKTRVGVDVVYFIDLSCTTEKVPRAGGDSTADRHMMGGHRYRQSLNIDERKSF